MLDKSEDERVIEEIAKELIPFMKTLPEVLKKAHPILERCRTEWVARKLVEHLRENGGAEFYVTDMGSERFTEFLIGVIDRVHNLMSIIDSFEFAKLEKAVAH